MSRRVWYEAGLPPFWFEEMSLRQAGEYLDGLAERRKEEFRTQAVLLDGMAKQILSIVSMALADKNSHPKYLTLDKLYPDYFGKKTAAGSEAEQAALVWAQFLGIDPDRILGKGGGD